MKDTVLLVVSLASLALMPWKVTASRVSGLVDQVINVTVVVDDLGFDVSEKLLCEASVPYIKFIEDNSEQDSLLGIIILYTQYCLNLKNLYFCLYPVMSIYDMAGSTTISWREGKRFSPDQI